MTLRLYVHSPRAVLAGQVNQTTFTYPIGTVAVDSLTTGILTDAQPGMTVVFGTQPGYSDRGRQRIRLEGVDSTLYFGRSSRGRNAAGGADDGRDGEVDLEDNLYFQVWDERRVWAKPPAIEPVGDGVVIYKDGYTIMGAQMNQPPPVANGGAGFAGTATGSPLGREVTFSAANSFAVATGATITGYAWSVGDGAVTGGALNTDTVSVNFTPGFRYVGLTVTDSNTNTHTTWIPVLIDDPNDRATVAAFDSTVINLTPAGAELSVRVLSDLDALEYPNGALVMLWEDEPAGPSDRDHMRFIGWHHHDPGEITATRTGTLAGVTLDCHGVAGRLRQLPGFAQEVRNVIANGAQRWFEMAEANMDKYLHYLLHWHSTALEVAPFSWSGTGDTYAFTILGSDAANLYEQVQRVCQAMVPAFQFTANSRGELRVLPDPMLQDEADRSATVQRALTAADWSTIRAQHMPVPRVRTLRAGALRADPDDEIPLFALAPGDAPGQGEAEQDRESQAGLAPSQTALNRATGHAYARANAREGMFSFTLAAGAWPAIEPADITWITVNVPAGLTTPRGRSGTARMLPHEVSIRYDHARTGLIAAVEVQAESETRGLPAKTVLVDTGGNPPADEDEWWGGDDYWSDNFPIEPGEPPSPYYGDPMAYVLWDGAHVMRTWDIMATSPTWELVDTGITGTIRDGQYVTLADTAGMWLMTTDAIWWCEDILADAPAWTAVLTLATVQAADATPPTGAVEFKSMFQGEDSNPGFCIVATGWNAQSIGANYEHAYFWHTSNYGASWTQVDMNGFLFSNSGISRGYTLCGLHGINIHRSSGTIFAMRGTPRVVSSGRTAVFVSEDYGATWAKRYEIAGVMTDTDSGALLDPFPDINDPSWLVRASSGQAIPPSLYKTTDAWATGAQSALPTGYDRVAGVWRPNSRTLDPAHLLAWHRNESTTHGELLETLDGGANWTSLLKSGVAVTTQSRSVHNTPNGWPPLPDLWFVVRAVGSLGDPVIQITEDHFQTFSTREGNLSTLLGGTWVSGFGSGFALPRINRNA